MSKFGFEEVIKKVEQTKRELPVRLANMTQNYFVLSWRKQGFDDGKWQEVRRRIPGTPEFKYPKTKGLSRRTKPILVESGELRRRVANSVVVAEWNAIRLLVDLPYADKMNKTRQFIGQTKELTQKQTIMVESFFDKVWY